MSEIQKILHDGEAIKWQGIVNRKALSTMLIIGLVITFALSTGLYLAETIPYTQDGVDKEFSGSLAAAIVLGIGLLANILSYFYDKVKEFAITEKKVIIKSGIIGTDFKSINFDEIKEALVDVGLIGKIFHVGSIKIDTGKTNTYSTGGSKNSRGRIKTKTMYSVLKHIDKPYETYKLIQGHLQERKESLYSGRADRESNPGAYKNK